MNRTTLGLAVGAGYLLGRTRKLKMALAVGSLVAGKKLNLGPGALAELARRQLSDNPQFKEIGDQLRQELRGVGKAASGAMVERQLSSLADRLHDRTAQMRGGPDSSETGSEEEPENGEDGEDRADRSDGEEREDDGDREPQEEQSAGKSQAKKPAAKKAPARKTGSEQRTGPAKKTAAKKTAAKKTGARRETTAKKPAGSRSAGSAKGGDER
ncbi:DNA primase [Streptomyces sp. NEAU-sy36]|uniref:DNA primase n=1 Tax=unclassified Streptomyces TaxID=2593676 RepID=UPI0015D59151|nr:MULTISPECIES: DNA primase [unclassified Streptomyces]QLJ03993.1 DNA primase [Streptomyces sp. NEAU-sy36]